jgi:hypothetical protein
MQLVSEVYLLRLHSLLKVLVLEYRWKVFALAVFTAIIALSALHIYFVTLSLHVHEYRSLDIEVREHGWLLLGLGLWRYWYMHAGILRLMLLQLLLLGLLLLLPWLEHTKIITVFAIGILRHLWVFLTFWGHRRNAILTFV